MRVRITGLQRSAVAGLAAVAMLPAVADAATIRVASDGYVSRLGGFDIRDDPRLRNAVRAFGDPDARYNPGGHTEACRVVWRQRGLRMTFSNFGLIPDGRTACHGSYGNAQAMTIRGRAGRVWRTWRGLRLGMTERDLRRRHPAATRHAHGYWLTTVTHPYGGDCPCRAPGLRAKVTDGRVTSLRARIGAAGD